ncbi:MAG: 30S ribosomal protein S6 [Gemmataceae bacterium]
MPANVYECMLMLDTSKVAGDVTGAAEQIHALLEKQHAEILASRPWDERRLAYSIKDDRNVVHKKALYYLIYFRAEGGALPTLEREFHLSEVILRFLALKIDPKLVDTMLALARDEHAMVAYHNIQDEDDEGSGPPPRRQRKEQPREEKAEGEDTGGEEAAAETEDVSREDGEVPAEESVSS